MSSNQNQTIFLSFTSKEEAQLRNELAQVLERAGINVNTNEEEFEKNNNSLDKLSELIHKTPFSVHILYSHYEPINEKINLSLAKFQIEQARKELELNPGNKVFVWLPPSTDLSKVDSKQLEFINDVRNNITKNMVFSNATTAIQLADDIRSMIEVKEEIDFNVNVTDIFLIFNQLDEGQANDITDMLSDIVPVEKLNIIQDSDVDYSEFCKQQIPKSKLAVVYFKNSGDWAVPFTQQVWKKIGGAATITPILLIGDDVPSTNAEKKFNAPKVISSVMNGELIPLEIKVQYDKTISAS